MVDRFCQPFSSNTSRNKGVLHALVACASGRFVDNLCARRPKQSWIETDDNYIHFFDLFLESRGSKRFYLNSNEPLILPR